MEIQSIGLSAEGNTVGVSVYRLSIAITKWCISGEFATHYRVHSFQFLTIPGKKRW
jgi:hypothetical protein